MTTTRIALTHRPVVGILRGFTEHEVEHIVPACRSGGLQYLEITMNSPHAVDLIRQASGLAGGELSIGAGTVLDEAALDAALGAGATFIVTPAIHERVIRRCLEARIPVMPGAFTPTEIVRAWDQGATLVKVFPADQLGPGYIKSVKAPLPHLKLLPTGSVTLESLPRWLAAGADGFGVGSPLFSRERIEMGDWRWVTEQCRAWRNAVGPAH